MSDQTQKNETPGPQDGVVMPSRTPRMRGQLYEATGLLETAMNLIRSSTMIAGDLELIETADRLFEIEWHDRSETPPTGRLWASDGYSLWTILSDGQPVPAGATRVLYWATMLIPKPPLLRQETANQSA